MKPFRVFFAVSMLLCISSVLACAVGEPKVSAFDKDVDALIDASCSFIEPCNIKIADATKFDWDEMVVFRPGILGVEAEATVPGTSRFQGEFNRKIAFLKNGNIVRIDEAAEIIEGEHTPPGFLFFEIDARASFDYLRFSNDAVFSVTRRPVSRGTSYRLVCENCTTAPVYHKLGSDPQ